MLDLLLAQLFEPAVPTQRFNSNASIRDSMGNPQGSHTLPTRVLYGGSLWLILIITRLLMIIITRLLFFTAALPIFSLAQHGFLDQYSYSLDMPKKYSVIPGSTTVLKSIAPLGMERLSICQLPWFVIIFNKCIYTVYNMTTI